MIFIGIDCGTQSTKVMFWNAETKKVLSSGAVTYDLISTRQGQKEQDPQLWLNAIETLICREIKKGSVIKEDIRGISVSGQQHGLILLDDKDVLLRPAKLWCDTEPTDVLLAFKDDCIKNYALDIEKDVGINIPVAFTLAKVLWVKKFEPTLFKKISKVLLPHQYINYWLTKKYNLEYSDASGTGFFNTRLRTWSQDVSDAVDSKFFQLLPPLISSDEPSGFLCNETAALLGLPPGIPVASGGGDNMMAALGTGNIADGVLTMSLGTSGTLFTHSSAQIDSNSTPDINAFCSSTNGWLPLISTMNVTNAVNAFRDILSIPLVELDDFLKKSPPGSEGIYCFPWLNGARLPNIPDAKASIHGITSTNFTKANLVRSVVEAVSFKLCKGIDIFKKQGFRFDEIRVIGGGARSDYWCQIIADITGLKVVRPEITDAAALGAAFQSEWCYRSMKGEDSFLALSSVIASSLSNIKNEFFLPQPEKHAQYKSAYEDFHIKLEHHVAFIKSCQ